MKKHYSKLFVSLVSLSMIAACGDLGNIDVDDLGNRQPISSSEMMNQLLSKKLNIELKPVLSVLALQVDANASQELGQTDLNFSCAVELASSSTVKNTEEAVYRLSLKQSDTSAVETQLLNNQSDMQARNVYLLSDKVKDTAKVGASIFISCTSKDGNYTMLSDKVSYMANLLTVEAIESAPISISGKKVDQAQAVLSKAKEKLETSKQVPNVLVEAISFSLDADIFELKVKNLSSVERLVPRANTKLELDEVVAVDEDLVSSLDAETKTMIKSLPTDMKVVFSLGQDTSTMLSFTHLVLNVADLNMVKAMEKDPELTKAVQVQQAKVFNKGSFR